MKRYNQQLYQKINDNGMSMKINVKINNRLLEA